MYLSKRARVWCPSRGEGGWPLGVIFYQKGTFDQDLVTRWKAHMSCRLFSPFEPPKITMLDYNLHIEKLSRLLGDCFESY